MFAGCLSLFPVTLCQCLCERAINCVKCSFQRETKFKLSILASSTQVKSIHNWHAYFCEQRDLMIANGKYCLASHYFYFVTNTGDSEKMLCNPELLMRRQYVHITHGEVYIMFILVLLCHSEPVWPSGKALGW